MKDKSTNNVHGGDPSAVAARLNLGDAPPVRLDFSVNTNPLGAPASVHRLAVGAGWLIEKYPPAYARPAARALAAAHQVDPCSVSVGNGSTEIMSMVLKALNPACPAWVFPCYAGYREVCEANGMAGVAVDATTQDFSICFDRLEESSADLIFLASPNNPTGTLLDPGRILSLASRWPERWIVLDESFMDFVEESRELSLIRADIPENLIVIKSLTKFFAIPGLRLGMAYARPGVTEMLNMAGLPWSVNALAQKAAETLYQAEDYIRASRTKCRSLRDYLAVRIDALPGWSAVPSTANFILARLPGELSASRLQADLIKKGILIRSCADFQGLGEQYIRLAVRPKRETDELLDAITRISHRIPVVSADSTTARARIGKTPDCSMSIRLLRRFPNSHPRSSTLRPLPPHGGQAATKSCEICGIKENSQGPKQKRSAIMVVGTTSDSGKTVLAAGLCRHFARQGVKVAPFKAQNMSLNSGVTREGGEMGRAQIVQAEAAGIEPHTDMNPVLLKPVGDAGSQVIVDGKAIGNFRAREYYRMKNEMKAAARAAFDRLSRGHDLVILEGAGSPAEINLMEEDFVNMSMAEYAGADVILVADIDRGGVFASILGTVALLPHRFRRLVKGIVINKFRGDESLLAPGIAEVEKITGIPVIGVLPYVHNLRIEDEDSMGLAGRMSAGDSIVDIAVVRFGRISNYTDFNSLENTDSVSVRFVDRPDEVGHPDLVILPGTKNTRADLQAIHESGMANAVKALAGSGVPVFGICGGYQMLGTRVADPNGVEGEPGEDKGLNLIAMDTVLAPSKELARVEGSIRAKLPFATAGTPFSGYEIHAGRSSVPGGHQAPLLLSSRRSSAVSEPAGSISDDGLVFGCYIHGFFDSPQLREQVLDWLCRRKNAAPRQWRNRPSNDFEGLADLVKSRLDLDRIR